MYTVRTNETFQRTFHDEGCSRQVVTRLKNKTKHIKKKKTVSSGIYRIAVCERRGRTKEPECDVTAVYNVICILYGYNNNNCIIIYRPTRAIAIRRTRGVNNTSPAREAITNKKVAGFSRLLYY